MEKKYLGLIILLIGVFIMITPALMDKPVDNTYIIAGSLTVIVGFLAFIMIGRRE